MTEFERIYQEYFDQVFLYIRRLSGDVHLAEDINQTRKNGTDANGGYTVFVGVQG
jgi:hypothetical protein